MTRRNKLIVLSACLTMSAAFGVSVSPAAEDGKAFTVETDKFGTVYRVNMSKVKSPADLMTVPGVKIAWDTRGHHPNGYLANVRDLDGDGKIDLIASAQMKDGTRVVRYGLDSKRLWTSEKIRTAPGHESGMAIEDMDGDGKFEVVISGDRQLWCLSAETGKTKWKVALPRCQDNHQASVVGHFLDRKRFAVICRVYGEVTCYDENGKTAWTYRISHKQLYGHEMAHYDADGDGLDEAYISLDGKFLAIGGNGKLLWSDASCRNHSDFILCGDVDGDGDREIVYDTNGCHIKRGPIVFVDGPTGKLVRKWTYARPGKDHLQRAVLGDFDPSKPGLELAAVGKRQGSGGLILWSAAGAPAWRQDITTGWVAWGDWDGNGKPDILVTGGLNGGNGWEVWTGAGKRIYAITGMGGMPMGVESAGQERRDVDGNGKAEILMSPGDGFIVLMEAP